MLLVFLVVRIKKQPSPVANPANQQGFWISLSQFSGLGTDTILVKCSFNFSGNPKFNEALKLNIFKSPSHVKCSLVFIKS